MKKTDISYPIVQTNKYESGVEIIYSPRIKFFFYVCRLNTGKNVLVKKIEVFTVH